MLVERVPVWLGAPSTGCPWTSRLHLTTSRLAFILIVPPAHSASFAGVMENGTASSATTFTASSTVLWPRVAFTLPLPTDDALTLTVVEVSSPAVRMPAPDARSHFRF